jgi:hypothetical protein
MMLRHKLIFCILVPSSLVDNSNQLQCNMLPVIGQKTIDTEAMNSTKPRVTYFGGGLFLKKI